MKKFITPLLTCLFTVLFLISCTKEEPLQLDTIQETEQSEVIVEQVDFNSIPELSQALNDVSGKSRLARSYAEKGDSKFWIDEEDVLKLKDSVNNESYSIIIHTNEPTPTSFYNLIVTKRTDGNPIIPFVVEYKFENGDVFSFAEDEEKKFDGTVNIYSLREFANATGLNARNTGAVACFQDVGRRNHTVVGNNNSGSTGGSPSGGTSTTGSPNTSGTVSVTRPHISVSRTRSRGSVSVGQGTFYMPPLTSDKKTQKGSTANKDESTECPKGWVSIPINEVDKINNKIDNPCAAKIVNKATLADNEISNVINAIFSGNTQYDLNYKDQTLSQSSPGGFRTATTIPNVNSKGQLTSVDIIFDTGYLGSATDISIFSTAIHEGAHAALIGMVNNGIIASSNPRSDYADLANEWSAYIAVKRGITLPRNTTGFQNAQHEILSELVDVMTSAIMNFGRSKGYDMDEFYYEGLAWGGLNGTVAHTLLGDDIIDTFDNINQWEAEGDKILANGTPCN